MAKEILRPSQYRKAEVVAEELDVQLSDKQQQELNQLYEEQGSQYVAGQLLMGTVISKDPSGAVVDINYKSNGFIPAYEFSKREFEELKEGSEIEVILDELENLTGSVVLSYENAKALRAWARISELYEAGEPVEGVVTHKVKGGLSVDVGIQAFLPGSQVDLHRVTDFDQFVGQTITADIIKLNKKRGNIIISRRKYLSSRRDESRKKVLASLEVGSTIEGVVKNITNYGVFIDIGGVDGLLHITDMTWGRISHPSEIVGMGETVKVKVLAIDKDNNKISLGMKQLEANPWKDLGEGFKEGAQVTGKIASITDYGLFVEVQKGIEGLAHISEISWTDRITDLSKRYDVGQEIEAIIVSIDLENRRMSLSIKQLQRNPWQAVQDDYKVGQKITGTVTNVTDFGVFIQLIPGVDGLAHVSDLSWTEHIENPADTYKKGDSVEAVILSIDEQSKKIALGIKQLTQDPWESVEKEYPMNSIVKGVVSKILNYGTFVRLANGIEGMVHASEFEGAEQPEVGKELEIRVSGINKEENKLTLSTQLEPVERKPQAKKATSRKTAQPSSFETKSAASGKSALQLELEKHAARQTDEPKKEDN